MTFGASAENTVKEQRKRADKTTTDYALLTVNISFLSIVLAILAPTTYSLVIGHKHPHLARSIYISDQEVMLHMMKKNIELNNAGSTVKACVMDWGNPLSASTGPDNESIPKPDLILAADCVYFEPSFPLLEQTLKDLVVDDAVCIFCYKERRKADRRFMSRIRKLFSTEELKVDWSDENRHKVYL